MSSTTCLSQTAISERTARIRDLNDRFRTDLKGGRLLLTRGIIGRPDVDDIVTKVRTFSDFNPDNDPYHEHDFGAFDSNGDPVFWKIDYYDHTMQSGSPDPGDANVTSRVLTIMLASEY